jgi:hypothetical protein
MGGDFGSDDWIGAADGPGGERHGGDERPPGLIEFGLTDLAIGVLLGNCHGMPTRPRRRERVPPHPAAPHGEQSGLPFGEFSDGPEEL